MPFLSDPEFKIHGSDKWQLTAPLMYETRSGIYISVPEGFITDLASIPRLFRSIYSVHGQHTRAAVIHDYLYSQSDPRAFTRSQADRIFYEAMLELGVRKSKAYVMYLGVRSGGYFAWK